MVCDLLFVFKTRRKLCLWEDTQETGDTGCLVGGEVDDRDHGWDKGYISFYTVNFETQDCTCHSAEQHEQVQLTGYQLLLGFFS